LSFQNSSVLELQFMLTISIKLPIVFDKLSRTNYFRVLFGVNLVGLK
jgi:hypothetical protein